MTESPQYEDEVPLGALADEIVQRQVRVDGVTLDLAGLAELHVDVLRRLMLRNAVRGRPAVAELVAELRHQLDLSSHRPPPPVVSALGSMSLWSAAYWWAALITTLAGHTPADRAGGAVFDETTAPDPGPTMPRVLLAYAITAAARDVHITADIVTSLDTLANLSLPLLREACLRPELTLAALANPSHGHLPSPGEPGYEQFLTLVEGFALRRTATQIEADPALMQTLTTRGTQLVLDLEAAADAVDNAIALVAEPNGPPRPTTAWLYPYLDAYLRRPTAAVLQVRGGFGT